MRFCAILLVLLVGCTPVHVDALGGIGTPGAGALGLDKLTSDHVFDVVSFSEDLERCKNENKLPFIYTKSLADGGEEELVKCVSNCPEDYEGTKRVYMVAGAWVDYAVCTIDSENTESPTVSPTVSPTLAPSPPPTLAPTASPTLVPSASPTWAPSASQQTCFDAGRLPDGTWAAGDDCAQYVDITTGQWKGTKPC